MKILILNGPNLNLLHQRDKNIYGDSSLKTIEEDCKKLASEIGAEVTMTQSNDEGQLVSQIQEANENFDGIIINAAAYTHTSVAIRDALEIFTKPKIELHISNIFKREEFRQHSFLSNVVDGVISGLGVDGYQIALLAMSKMIK